MKKQILFIVAVMFLISLCSVYAIDIDDIYQKDAQINYTKPCYNAVTNGSLCSSTASCNLSVLYPDRSFWLNNGEMTNSINYFNYTLGTTGLLGTYRADMYCCDGNHCGSDTFYFKVTTNGKDDPEGIVIVLFIIGFLIISAGLIYLFVTGIGHAFTLDYDVIDVAFNWGIYFVLFAFYMMAKFYMGNADINNLLEVIIIGAAITHLLVPAISLGVSLIVGTMVKRQANLGRYNRVLKGGYRYG